MVAHTFSPSFLRQRQADLWEFTARLVYIVNSRTVRLLRERPCIKREKKRGKDGGGRKGGGQVKKKKPEEHLKTRH